MGELETALVFLLIAVNVALLLIGLLAGLVVVVWILGCMKGL